MAFILGRKIGMTQIWKNDEVIPVTLIEAGPCFVSEVKDKSVQLGFEKLKEKKIKKTQKKAPYRHLKEFRVKDSELKAGDTIDVSIFEEGKKVKVSGVSKGKGFQGGVKRWGFSGRDATHGTKHEERTIGSVGSSFPERVIKGRKMPGRMGHQRVTVRNLEVVQIDKEKNQLALKGAIPGRKGTLLEVRSGS